MRPTNRFQLMALLLSEIKHLHMLTKPMKIAGRRDLQHHSKLIHTVMQP